MRLTLAFAALRQHRTRTILATLGVAVAAAMLLDMVMLSGGMRVSFKELLLSKGFQLRISPKGTLPYDTDATIGRASEIIPVLRANPDIVEVSPVLGASLYVTRGRQVITSVALGVDPTQQGDYTLLSGHDVIAPDAMVVNDDFLRATGAKIGDTLSVASGYDPQVRTFAGVRRLVITGRAQFLYFALGQPGTALQLATLQAMAGPTRTDRVSLFMIKARASANVEQVRQWIATTIPRVTAISTQSAMAQVDERLSYFRQLAFILGAVSLVVGFLLVTTLMTVSVNERIGEICVMRAIGVSSRHIIQQVLLEGIAISVVGTIAGLGLGLITSHYLNAILSDFPGLPAAIRFFVFQPKAAWSALGMLTASGTIAGLYPAWRAASLPIATTLRQEAVA